MAENPGLAGNRAQTGRVHPLPLAEGVIPRQRLGPQLPRKELEAPHGSRRPSLHRFPETEPRGDQPLLAGEAVGGQHGVIEPGNHFRRRKFINDRGGQSFQPPGQVVAKHAGPTALKRGQAWLHSLMATGHLRVKGLPRVRLGLPGQVHATAQPAHQQTDRVRHHIAESAPFPDGSLAQEGSRIGKPSETPEPIDRIQRTADGQDGGAGSRGFNRRHHGTAPPPRSSGRSRWLASGRVRNPQSSARSCV